MPWLTHAGPLRFVSHSQIKVSITSAELHALHATMSCHVQVQQGVAKLA